jgi:hypothetical protein
MRVLAALGEPRADRRDRDSVGATPSRVLRVTHASRIVRVDCKPMYRVAMMIGQHEFTMIMRTMAPAAALWTRLATGCAHTTVVDVIRVSYCALVVCSVCGIRRYPFVLVQWSVCTNSCHSVQVQHVPGPGPGGLGCFMRDCMLRGWLRHHAMAPLHDGLGAWRPPGRGWRLALSSDRPGAQARRGALRRHTVGPLCSASTGMPAAGPLKPSWS